MTDFVDTTTPVTSRIDVPQIRLWLQRERTSSGTIFADTVNRNIDFFKKNKIKFCFISGFIIFLNELPVVIAVRSATQKRRHNDAHYAVVIRQ